MSSRRPAHVVDYTYDDPRTGDRVRERRVQEMPFEYVHALEQHELAQEFDRPKYQSVKDDRPYEVDQTRTRRTLQRADADGHLPPHDRGRQDLVHYQRRPSRRRDDYHDDQDSQDDGARERRQDRRRRREYRDRDRRDGSRNDATKTQNNNDDEDEGLLWYSMKSRRDGNVLERHFDSSYDGLIAAGAGAAIGLVTARHFGGDENKGLKMLGGAVLGAATLNAAENWYRVYTEEKVERRHEREEGAVANLGAVKLP